ncbi:hypothetical protein LEP1GSC074_2325 [Leptospira noguchii str. Hook]|nr:hypothetical protein LEP1GSC041_1404 [Leptospira noguchii str. 2006001870]EMS84484.1 hypothetical protein LEP1GSC074_2325 [Leptospira noguchii str. Hook]
MQNSFLNNSNIQKTITTNRRLRNLSFGLSIHNPSECKVLTKKSHLLSRHKQQGPFRAL